MDFANYNFREWRGWLRLWIVASFAWIIVIAVQSFSSPLSIDTIFYRIVEVEQLQEAKTLATLESRTCFRDLKVSVEPYDIRPSPTERAIGGTDLDDWLQKRESNTPPDSFRIEVECVTKLELRNRLIGDSLRAFAPPILVPMLLGLLGWLSRWVISGFRINTGVRAQISRRIETGIEHGGSVGLEGMEGSEAAISRHSLPLSFSPELSPKRKSFDWYYYQFWNWLVLPVGSFLLAMGLAWKVSNEQPVLSVLAGIAFAAAALKFRWGAVDDLIAELD